MKRIIALLLLLAPVAAFAAAPAPSMSFDVAVGNTPTITWSCPAGATSATASGSWTGSKSLSGSETVTRITDTAIYALLCTTDTGNSAALSWVAPTKNTDGSNLTDLAGFKVYHGTSPTNLTLLQTISSPTVLTFTANSLAAGTHYFAVSAYNSVNVESALSGVGSKTIAAPSSVSASVKILVPAAPAVPTIQ